MRFSFTRFLRERRLRGKFEPVRIRLQQELGVFLKQPCRLTAARGKGGYDRMYDVWVEGRRIAIMRVKNSGEDQADHGAMGSLRCALDADRRLEHEWSCYAILSGRDLAPKPIWRSEDAIVSAYYPYQRVSEILKKDRRELWDLLPRIFDLLRGMHGLGIVHMDLNVGNMLFDPHAKRVMAIDFEYAPLPALSFEQACSCDCLRVVNDVLRPRRGGSEIARHRERFLGILESEAPSFRAGATSSILSCFPNILRDAEVCRAMGVGGAAP